MSNDGGPAFLGDVKLQTSGGYEVQRGMDLRTQLAEARDSALEEAASVVDSHRDEFAGHHSKSFAQGRETQAIGCAGAIRSLKTQEATNED